MSALSRLQAAWSAELAKTRDQPKDMILTNWHLGAVDGLYRAMAIVREEAARPAVTREAVMEAVTKSRYTGCFHDLGNCCAPDKCPCARTIDAIMALIGGEA